ncbi:unnamed protein product [Orchesella dallaii]|uniref:Nucleolar protein 6 n=1 Tax=Orchesella dallaii TaxID=48710 RepID=A0ABP1S3S9_9HEXA
MPAQLFVDSEGEEDDLQNGNGNSSEDGDGEDGDVKVDDDDANGAINGSEAVKKRKLNKGKNSKKGKKLGPKQTKGSKDPEQLSAHEIKELTAKEYAQYSNLYNVQIEEVLGETKISTKRKNELMDWFESFKKFAMKHSKSKAFLIQDYEKMLDKIKFPLPTRILRKDFQGLLNQSLKWHPPSTVEILGSWSVGTALNKVSSVDIFLEMPFEYLLKSDYKNHRYHIKRAIYLGFLAKKLKKRGDQVTFSLVNGEVLKPVLKVTLNKTQILIHAVPPKNFFKMQKLSCDKNNLRYEHFFEKERPEDEPETSTQNYNATILQDSLAWKVHEEESTFLEGKPHCQNAIKLLKIWLTQRGLAQGYGAFSGCILTQFFRYLLKIGQIPVNVAAFQLVRVFFINLIQMDLVENGISFADDVDMKLAHNQFDTVFLDSTGLLNFTSNLSKFTYKRLQFEAQRALRIIDGGNVSGFMALFITPVKFAMNFDHVIRFPNMDKLTSCIQRKLENEPSILNHSGFIYPVVVTNIGSLIETCFGKRITLMDSELPTYDDWELEDDVPSPIHSIIRFGLNINRELSQRLIEKCESESEYDIEQFKEFWGKKSELRRFKDGTLLESVVIDNLIGLSRSRICYQMFSFILKRHLNYQLAKDDYLDGQIESLIENKYMMIKPSTKQEPRTKKTFAHGKLIRKRKISDAKDELVPVSVDDITRRVSNSFDELSKILRMLEELPLAISTVQGTSSVLRFSHVQPTPPQLLFAAKLTTNEDSKCRTLLLSEAGKDEEADNLPVKVPKFVEPVGVIIHLETSGQWPDDMKAIDRLKCAFLIKIGELLTSKFGLTVQPYARYLDVLKDGFVFRIRITYFRELTLLRELRGPDGVLRVRDTAESVRLEKEALILPQLTSTLHSFHLQYEAFGKTCRLAKRWVASQLLLSSPMEYTRTLEEPDFRLSEEALELIVANLFINYAPHLSFPNEAQVGFQRFLYLVANTDFHAIPIIVNFNDKLSSKEVSAVELEFVKKRSTLPPLFIATPFDKKGSVWTRSLSNVILSRLQLLAKQALAVVENCFSSLSFESEIMKIFRPSLNHFDIIIHLKRHINSRSFQRIESISEPVRYQEYQKKMDEMIPVVEFDPVQVYLQDLRNAYGHMAAFLHDTYGGQYITVVWKPQIFKATNFTATAVKGRQLSKDAEKIVTNVNGAIESFQEMGSGIVHEIEARSDRWQFED